MVEEAVYSRFIDAMNAMPVSLEKTNFSNASIIKTNIVKQKTEDKNQKTEDQEPRTDIYRKKTNDKSFRMFDASTEDQYEELKIKQFSENMLSTQHSYNLLFVLEEHERDCMQANRPAALALVEVGNDEYVLFYRRSTYDTGIDSSFRRYLLNQKGKLVAYRYFNSIDNLRAAFHRIKRKLRHNGKNVLTRQEAISVLDYFSALRFL